MDGAELLSLTTVVEVFNSTGEKTHAGALHGRVVGLQDFTVDRRVEVGVLYLEWHDRHHGQKAKNDNSGNYPMSLFQVNQESRLEISSFEKRGNRP